MQCFINPVTNSVSELHQQLYLYFNENQELADKAYNFLFSKEFKQQFGDWTVSSDKFEDRISPQGEPLLFTNQFRRSFFKLQDGSKLFIDKPFLNLNYTQRKALVSSSIEYLFGGNLSSLDDVDGIDFRNLYREFKDDISEGEDIVANPAYLVLQGDLSALQDLEEEIKREINLASKAITDLEDIQSEEFMDISDTENTKTLDLATSYEKNSKESANVHIKFLLRFVPKQRINEKNEAEFEEIPFTLSDGSSFSLMTYNSFDEMYNYFQEELANIPNQIKDGKYIDRFELMIDRLTKKYGKTIQDSQGNTIPNINWNLDVMYAINNLLLPLPDFKKNLFVQSFSLSKLNFYTASFKDNESEIFYKFFSSSEGTSRASKITTEFLSGFEKTKFVDSKNKTFNKSLAESVNIKFQAYKQKISELDEDSFVLDDLIAVADDVKKYLDFLNIDMSLKSVVNYINTFEGDTPHYRTILALDNMQYIFKRLANTDNVFVNGEYVNPLTLEKGKIKELASVEAISRKEISENTILGANNKKYWNYSNMTFLDIKLHAFKNNPKNEIGTSKFYKNSVLLNSFYDSDGKPTALLEEFQINNFANFKNEEDSDGGVDNNDIQEIDVISEVFNKAALTRKGEKFNIFNTATPSGKARAITFKTSLFINSGLKRLEDGTFGFSDELVNIYKGYFIDEYLRIREAYNHVIAIDKQLTELKKDPENNKEEIADLESQLIVNYHYGKGGKLFTEVNGKKVPAGNAFKFTLFDDLNYDKYSWNDFIKQYNKLDSNTMLFDVSNNTQNYMYPILTEKELVENQSLNQFIIKKLNDSLNNSLALLKEKELVSPNNIHNRFIDKDIFDSYMLSNKDKEFATLNFVADSLFNQHIMMVEYSKLFTGDYAFYKNLDDYSKRVPETYTDGVYMNLKPTDPVNFTLAVGPEIIKNTDLYDGVNVDDAQGYITFDRWKFIIRRLHKYSPTIEQIIDRIEKGEETAEDISFAAQPVKGVYYDIINGKPTYVKYSAAVLLPRAVKGHYLENLLNSMIAQGVDEYVPQSAVKVGGVTSSDVLGKNGEYKENIVFNTIQLNNHAWKLQQDLSPKGVKETLIGSQILKNIIRDIDVNKLYNGVKGSDRVQNITNLVNQLSNIELDNLAKKIGLDLETGIISNREVFYEKLLAEVNRNGGDLNSVEALKKEFPLDFIVTNRIKFQNLVSSMINNAAVKLKSNGGAFIQMSGFGWNRQEGIDETQLSGVTMLTSIDKLQAPKLDTKNKKIIPGQVFITHNEIAKYIPNYRELPIEDLKKLIDDKLRYIIGYRIPNQDLSSSDALEVVGILPPGMGDTLVPYIDITTKNGSDFDIDKMYVMMPYLKPIFTPKTYKDALQFLNKRFRGKTIKETTDNLLELLDKYEVDTPIGSKEELVKTLLTKTDIQIMSEAGNEVIKEILFKDNDLAKEFREEYGIGQVEKLEYYTDQEGKETKKGITNKLIEEFIGILTADTSYDALVKPLDNNFLKKDIDTLVGLENKDSNFNFFSPLYQIKKKFDNNAGGIGTGFWANHGVDHAFAQIAKLRINVDLGVGHVKSQKTKDGSYNYTSLGEVKDTDKKNRISNVMSWFLSAFVDIEKDPYITIGNHNSATSLAEALLIRAGVPQKWINRLLAQEILFEYSRNELNKDSKILQKSKDSIKIAKERYKNKLLALGVTSKQMTQIDKELENTLSLGKAIRENTIFTAEEMEKAALIAKNNTLEKLPIQQQVTYYVNQLHYLTAFEKYNELGQKLNKTTLQSKADVNGAKSNISDHFIYQKGMEEIFNYKNKFGTPLFANLQAKFDKTFLGQKHKNSVDVVEKIFSKEFVTYNKNFGKPILNTFYNTNKGTKNFKKNLAKIESAMFGYIVGKSAFFKLSHNDLKEMFIGKNSIQARVIEAKKKYQDNVLLQNMDISTVDGLGFVEINNFKNKPNSFKDDLIRAWEDLYIDDKVLAEDLAKYSYVTSNFQFNSNSFFEFIPHTLLKDVIDGSVNFFKGEDLYNYQNEFLDIFYKNNANLAPIVKAEFVDNKLYLNEFIKVKTSTSLTEAAPYVSFGNNLYKQLGFSEGYDLYSLVNKLGYSKKGKYIYENTPNSVFPANNKPVRDKVMQERIEEYIDFFNVVPVVDNTEDVIQNTGLINYNVNITTLNSALNRAEQDGVAEVDENLC